MFLVVVTQGLRLVRYCPHLAKFAAVYRRARREVMLMAVSRLPVAFHFTFPAGSNGRPVYSYDLGCILYAKIFSLQR